MLRKSRADRLYARFRRKGDARAMARLFDATAPELLKLAVYVTGDRHRAEDLVQSAFLLAIEKREAFDGSRPVMPWLCGIVANLARAERRRLRRVPPEQSVSGSPDPSRAAEDGEFRAAFERVRRELPAPYRPVLELYLEFGMTAKEIARVLERPAGTVRTQITRGLEMLRQRLPSGFVAGLSLAALLPASLDTVRAAVLRRAGETPVPVAVPSTLAFIGGLLVKKNMVLVGAVVLCVLLGGAWWVTFPLEAEEAPVPAAAAQMSVSAHVPELVRDVLPERATVAAPPAEESEVATPLGSVEVQLWWKSDGEPADHVGVHVVCWDLPIHERVRHAVTDDAGVCIVEDLPPGPVSVQASTGHRAEAEVIAGERTHVEIDVIAFAPVEGIVVDADGRPVPGADIWQASRLRPHRETPGRGGYLGQHGMFVQRSDADGRFQLRTSFGQHVAAFKAGYGPSDAVMPAIDRGRPSADPVHVELVLSRLGASLEVAVRRADGEPVANARVLAGYEVPFSREAGTGSTPPALRARTGGDGACAFTGLAAEVLPVQVRSPDFAPWKGEVDLTKGRPVRLEVELRAAATVRGVVLDAEGVPVADAMVSHGKVVRIDSSVAMTDASGEFVLRGLPEGVLELSAWKKSTGACEQEVAVVAGADNEWIAQLAFPSITGVVLDIDGRPSAGADVVWLTGMGGMDRVTTGEDGRFVLGPLDSGMDYHIIAEIHREGGGLVKMEQRDVEVGADLELRAVASAEHTARARGRLFNADGTPANVQISVRGLDSGVHHGAWIDEQGVFEFGPRPAGRVRITVTEGGRDVADLGEHDLPAHQTTELGDFHLPER